MLQTTSTVFASIMPKQNLSPIKTKAKEEELKEIIQNPNDPLAQFPVRAFGYSNEVGAAVSAMPGWGKVAEIGLWVPALMYLGADIYDKYRRGKEGDYTSASADAAVKQAVFQALASVILPTAAVKMGQGLTGRLAKLDGSGLNATQKEELLEKLQKDFAKAKFVKCDRYEGDVLISGKQLAWERVYDRNFLNDWATVINENKKKGIGKKLVEFFGHTKGIRTAVNAKTEDVENFLKKNVFDIYEKQTLVETGTLQEIEKTNKKGFIKAYKKAVTNAEKNYHKLIEDRPSFIIEKILTSSEKSYDELKEIINEKYPSINSKKTLVSGNGTSRTNCRELLKQFYADQNHKKLVENIAKKAEMSNEVINGLLQSRLMKLGVLKTVGGFISLACLAVPIDNFVHKYIIKKFLEPSLENVKHLQDRLSLR